MSRLGSKQPFRELSFQETRDRIAAIRRLAGHSDVDTLNLNLVPLSQGHLTIGIVLEEGFVLYRGVKWQEKPRRIKQLSYPPKEVVAQYGRLNRPNESKFYASTCRETPLYELRTSVGDLIAISRWVITNKLPVNTVGYHPKVYRANESSQQVPFDETRAALERDRPVQRLRDRFFAQEFSKPVAQGNEHSYKLSVAISERLLGRVPFAAEPEQKYDWLREGRNYGGLLYPTLAMRANGHNVVLAPGVVDRFLRLELVELVRVEDVSDLTYSISTLDFADTFTPDGEIEWSGKAPIPHGGHAPIHIIDSESGRQTIVGTNGEMIEVVSAEPSFPLTQAFR